MTGVEEVVLDICVLTRDQMRTGGWQQLGQARLGPVDELDPVTEGRDQDTVTQHPVLHRQLLKHERRPRLLSKRVHEQDYPCEGQGLLLLLARVGGDVQCGALSLNSSVATDF